VEIRKLLSLHPDVHRSGRELVSDFRPGIGDYAVRKIAVVVDRYYPQCAPDAYVSPYDDISGDLPRLHIYDDGQVCFIRIWEWNSRIHNLSFVFSQSKLVVFGAIHLRGRASW